MIRPGVQQVHNPATEWGPTLLDLQPGDVVVAFDIRRYERSVQTLAEMAAANSARVVLFTDQWLSPIASNAHLVFPAHVEAPSAWDSNSVLLVLIETLLAAVQALTREKTRTRMARLEELHAHSRHTR